MDSALSAGETFSHLSEQELKSLLLRVRLYAEWKVRARSPI